MAEKNRYLYLIIVMTVFKLSFASNNYSSGLDLPANERQGFNSTNYETVNRNLQYQENEYGCAYLLQEYEADIKRINKQITNSDVSQFEIETLKEFQKSYANLFSYVAKPKKLNTSDVEILKKELYHFVSNPKINNKEPESGALTSLFGSTINTKALIELVTDTLTNRAKEELARSFFDRVASIIDTTSINIEFQYTVKDSSGDKIKTDTSDATLSDLFPVFHQFLLTSRTQNYYRIGETIRFVCSSDVATLLPNIDEHLIPSNCKNELWYTCFDASNKIYNDLSKSVSVPKVLKNIKPSVLDSNSNDVKQLLNLISTLSTSIMKSNGDSWWDIRKNSLNYSGYRYYYYLMSSNSDFIKSLKWIQNKTYTNGNILSNDSTDLIVFNHIYEKVMPAFYKIAENAKQSSENENSIILAQNKHEFDSAIQYYLYKNIDIAYDILSILKELNDLLIENSNSENYKKIAKGLKYSKFGLDFYKGLANEQYPLAVYSAIGFIQLAIDDSQKNIVVNKNIIKFLTLSAEIAQARDVNAVKAVINKAMMPVGSYRMKRSVRFSSSLSSYVGAMGALEFIPTNSKISEHKSTYLSMSLPIGVDFTWSRGSEDHQRAAHSLFVSLIDLGVFASYRIENYESEDENVQDTIEVNSTPDIEFQHIFSPGIFYVLGIPKTPISFGAGIQYTPKLRSIEFTDSSNHELEISKQTAVRLGGFFAVDIPIINFAQKGATPEKVHKYQKQEEKRGKRRNPKKKKSEKE